MKKTSSIAIFLIFLLSSTTNAKLTWSKDEVCMSGNRLVVSVQIYSDTADPYEVWMGNELYPYPWCVEITGVVPYPDAGDAVAIPDAYGWIGWWLLRSENNMRGVHWNITFELIDLGCNYEIYLSQDIVPDDTLLIYTIGPPCPLFLPKDIDNDGDVDFYDFAFLARAWLSFPGDENWNMACDIAEPKDGIIDGLDLSNLVEDWLIQYTP